MCSSFKILANSQPIKIILNFWMCTGHIICFYAVTSFEIDGLRIRFCSPVFYSVAGRPWHTLRLYWKTCSAEECPAEQIVTCAFSLCDLAASYYECLHTFPGVCRSHCHERRRWRRGVPPTLWCLRDIRHIPYKRKLNIHHCDNLISNIRQPHYIQNQWQPIDL
jgi:hypothetical protein